MFSDFNYKKKNFDKDNFLEFSYFLFFRNKYTKLLFDPSLLLLNFWKFNILIIDN